MKVSNDGKTEITLLKHANQQNKSTPFLLSFTTRKLDDHEYSKLTCGENMCVGVCIHFKSDKTIQKATYTINANY